MTPGGLPPPQPAAPNPGWAYTRPSPPGRSPTPPRAVPTPPEGRIPHPRGCPGAPCPVPRVPPRPTHCRVPASRSAVLRSAAPSHCRSPSQHPPRPVGPHWPASGRRAPRLAGAATGGRCDWRASKPRPRVVVCSREKMAAAAVRGIGGGLGQSLRELRIHLCQRSAGSRGVR